MPVHVHVAQQRRVWSDVSPPDALYTSHTRQFVSAEKKLNVSSVNRTVDRLTDDDGDSNPALSRRSQAVGMVLCLLLVGLTVCLLGLLLHKRERR